MTARPRIFIERALLAAGLKADPAVQARLLREAGVPVSRDPRARWFADSRHPFTRLWLDGLSKGTVLESPPGSPPPPEPARGTGQHVFPDEVLPRD